MANSSAPSRPDSARDLDFDTIIIGAGISGLYQLYRLREARSRHQSLPRPRAPFPAPPLPGHHAPSPACRIPLEPQAQHGRSPKRHRGLMYHPDTRTVVDCNVLLAWKLDERLDGVKSAAFNLEVGGDGAVSLGLTAQQLRTGSDARCLPAAAK